MENYVKICVGKTRLGEDIYFNQPVPLSEQASSLSQIFDQMRSHFDAYAVFAFLSFREYQKIGESPLFEAFYNDSIFHLRKMTEPALNELKAELNIKTVFDIQNYGKTLVGAEYVDE